MAKKKSCQNIRNPRVLSAAERDFYGWVDTEVFTQSSMISSNDLPDLRREMRLTEDVASERDYVLEAADPSDREVLTRCRVAASQLHLNGWGFLRTFECVCLHFGFRPSWRIFLNMYQLHMPPPGNGFLSFCAYQGRRLFDAFEESIQEFKLHYFKVYSNPEARECRITTLDPLETPAFQFLQSLPVGLGKKLNFKCRWILDHSDAEVGTFLDSLLGDMEKKSRFDRLMQKMAEVEGMGPRSVLPHTRALGATSGASTSNPVAPVSTPTASVPPVPPSGAVKARKKPSAALGVDPVWEHKVNPIDRAFPVDYNFRAALDAGLTQGPIQETLDPLVPEQLLGTAQYLACKLTTCLQVGVENTFAAKVQLEKELAATKDQLELAEGECLSAFTRMKEVEEGAKVQAAKLESRRSTLEQERKKAELLTQSLKGKQTALDEAEATAVH
ncbi:hypothetical protein PIB30_075711 [Stylosanthes scabra]|uniref:Uncharacterized protein n=1 Tax=Stylosanthes scabra TaxID=79078 RepID=A0ABU6ZNS8_9FABA|nr:hypothetical protein [Stylosanthes scabra]